MEKNRREMSDMPTADDASNEKADAKPDDGSDETQRDDGQINAACLASVIVM